MCSCPLFTEEEMKRVPWGRIDFEISAEKDFCVSLWLDDGNMTLASNFAGVKPIETMERVCQGTYHN